MFLNLQLYMFYFFLVFYLLLPSEYILCVDLLPLGC